MRHSTPPRRPGPRRPARAGFSLIEVVIAMTILAIVLMSLAKLSTIITVRGRSNDLVAKRTAALQLESNKFGAMRYDSLATFSTADKTFDLDGFSYTRKLSITSPGSNRKTIKIVIVPTSSTSAKDSITFDRTKPSSSALCTTC